MSAFLIADVSPADMQAYRDSGYLEAVPEIAAEYGGVYRARGGRTEVLEGEWQPKRLVVIEFPSWNELQAFYHCKAYAPYRDIRQRLTESHIVALEGTDATPK
jgi:uncharacterized protein (DUF1330 family)